MVIILVLAMVDHGRPGLKFGPRVIVSFAGLCLSSGGLSLSYIGTKDLSFAGSCLSFGPRWS